MCVSCEEHAGMQWHTYMQHKCHIHTKIMHEPQETTAPSAWSSTQAHNIQRQGVSRTTKSHLNPLSKGHVASETRPRFTTKHRG